MLRRLLTLSVLWAVVVPHPASARSPLSGPQLGPVQHSLDAPPPDVLSEADFERAVAQFQQGDLHGARRQLEALLQGNRVKGDSKTRVHFLLGWISATLENQQQASANFYQVRKREDHPLREPAAFFEARADLLRGHPRTAIAECGTYRETWPEGIWLDECLLVEADAHVALGNHRSAGELFEEFVEKHPDDRRIETIHLRIAQSLEGEGRFEAAARRYRVLYIDHELPITARQATAGLDRMRSAGVPVDEISDEELYARACSLRRARQFDDSWDLYCDLVDRNQPGEEASRPALAARLQAEEHDFLWKNRRFEELGRRSARAYQAAPRASGAAEHLYWAVQGFSRSGYYEEAVHHQELGLRHFPRSRRFRNTWARTSQLYAGAGMYAEARKALIEEASHSSRGRTLTKRFYRAFYAYRAGDADTAISEFTTLVNGRSKLKVAALFYRGKARELKKDWRGARKDHRSVIKDDPDGWYATVLRSRSRQRLADPAELARARDGRWPGPARRDIALPSRLRSTPLAEAIGRGWEAPRPGSVAPLNPTMLPRARDANGRPAPPVFDGWSDPRLLQPRSSQPDDAEAGAQAASAPQEVAADSSQLQRTGDGLTPEEALQIPPTWEESQYWEPEAAQELFEEFVEDYSLYWPELPMIYELSRCGLGEIAGPMLAAIHGEIRDVRRSRRKKARVREWKASGGRGNHPSVARWSAILDLKLKSSEWLGLFAVAGYPGSVRGFALDSISFVQNDRLTPQGRDVWTLRFPAAYAPYVWQNAWENDVDPLLILAVMRAESLYRHDAISRAGAMGLVQIMPTTGNLVAGLIGDRDFRVERLLEPEVNIRLGTFYLGQLMDRFGAEQFPLAVGSYNGGPHNVGRWLRPKVGVPFEDFVEEIQFSETRAYIKKVIEFYAIYCEIYGDGDWVALPSHTLPDDPSVINF